MGLRIQDPIPNWITHLAYVRHGALETGEKNDILKILPKSTTPLPVSAQVSSKTGEVLVDLKNVNVQYSTRSVLKDINWQIRQGEKWHLQGTNGSGKTTLLSLITGDHPQSYTQVSPSSHLHLFGKPRSRLPTRQLQSMIGIVSPELFDAFPRRRNMSVWEAIGTGFDGSFVPSGVQGVGTGVLKPLDSEDVEWRVKRMEEVLEHLGPQRWRRKEPLTRNFKDRLFSDLSVGEQRTVLLMRALVGRPKLVLLDEVWSGMDEGMVDAACEYLRGKAVGDDQAVVVISHWAEEVPWRVEDGLQRFHLKNGVGKIVQ